jgi:hypothetical protein
MTFEISPPTGSPQMELELMSSAEASPVRTYQPQGRAPAWRASGQAYGRNTPVLLASYDRNSSSWRTSQRCLVEGWTVFSETWPRSGIMRNGIAYQLPPLVRLTDATASGLWPTPTAGDANGSGSRNTPNSKAHPGVSLTDAVRGDGGKGRIYPTPTTQDASNNGGPSQYGRKTLPLNAVIGGQLNPTWVEWLMGFPLGWTDLRD